SRGQADAKNATIRVRTDRYIQSCSSAFSADIARRKSATGLKYGRGRECAQVNTLSLDSISCAAPRQASRIVSIVSVGTTGRGAMIRMKPFLGATDILL